MAMQKLFSLIILITLSYTGYVSASSRVVLSGIKDAVNSDISLIVLKQAYGKLGIDVEYVPLPGERALQTANSGEVDGEVFRITNVQRKYNNLIPVPTPINILEGVAFSKRSDLKVSDWHSLRHLKIGIQVGIKFAERGTRGMKPVMVDTNEQLFKMLDAGRVDVAIVALTNGLKTLSLLKLKSIHAISPSIQQYPLYHYIHNKNVSLVPRLNAVLIDMKNSGEIKHIRDTFLQKMMDATR